MNRLRTLALLLFMLCTSGLLRAEERSQNPFLRVPASLASSPQEMKPYTQDIQDSDVHFEMLPIPGGEFVMGSPVDEEHRAADEGPQHRVKIEPF